MEEIKHFFSNYGLFFALAIAIIIMKVGIKIARNKEKKAEKEK